MKVGIVLASLALAATLFAQPQIPSGTILPLRLSTTINLRKAHPGERISAHLMQDVDLGSGKKLHAGTILRGRILAVGLN